MGATAAIITIGTALYSANGQHNAGVAAQDQANWNADVRSKQAQDALDRGYNTERRYQIGVNQNIGAQRAGFAAQGVEVGDGSALQVAQDTAAIGELDRLTIRNNAAREAWGYRVGETNFRGQGANALMQGNQQAAGTILTGAASVATMMSRTN